MLKLPPIPFLSGGKKEDFFLSLLFQQDKISAILFKEVQKTLVILASSEEKIDLSEATVEDLVIASDTVISKIEMSLPEGATLEKTIFSVPYSWVEEGKIKEERLNQLKKVSVELALVPMGFIVSIEAIIAFLQKKEGVPINGIFVELSESFLYIYLVRSGNILEVKHGKIEESAEKTVESLLASVIKFEVLPSKIILLNNQEAESIQQKFLSHHWTKQLPFQHLPQVAMLEKGFENEAIIHGVANQMGAAIKGDVSVSKFEEKGEAEKTVSAAAGTFGFSQDVDVAKNSAPIKEEMEEPVMNEKLYEKDIAMDEEIEESQVEPERPRGADATGGLLSSLFSFIPKDLSFLPKSLTGKGGRSYVIPLAAAVIVIALTAFYYMFLVHAEVTVFTGKKEFNDDVDITLTTSGSSSFDDKVLRIETVTEEVSGDETADVTGKKETGEKAKGEVTVFNKSDKKQTLEKGTTITSSNNLEFVLSDAVEIASTSAFATEFSNKKVKVEAAKFGKEYNFPSNTNFTVANISSSQVFAKNDVAFAGGTKEEIQVVTEEDMTALSESLADTLLAEAKKKASAKLGDDQELLQVVLTTKFDKKTFDKKEDQEAKTLKLSATITYTLGAYKKDELDAFLASSDSFDVPDDFKLSDEESELKLSDVSQEGKNITGKLSFNAIYKPQISIENIPAELKGKSVKAAEERLRQITGVSDVNIALQNSIPLLPSLLPFRAENIALEIKSEAL